VRRPGARFIELRSQKVAEKTKDGPGESPDIEMESSDAAIFDLSADLQPCRCPKGRFTEVISQKVKSAKDGSAGRPV
jgi:hypothetical protein